MLSYREDGGKLVGWLEFNVPFQCKYGYIRDELECGPMPNVMVALLNIGGALCSTPQSLADAHY